jgi:hypothetical protein
MDFLLFLATFVLFFVLTPGVVLSLPPKGSKLVTALVHALIFAILLTLFMECFKTDYKEGMVRVREDFESAYKGGGIFSKNPDGLAYRWGVDSRHDMDL